MTRVVIKRALIGQSSIVRSQRRYRRVQEPWSCASERSYKEGIVCSQIITVIQRAPITTASTLLLPNSIFQQPIFRSTSTLHHQQWPAADATTASACAPRKQPARAASSLLFSAVCLSSSTRILRVITAVSRAAHVIIANSHLADCAKAAEENKMPTNTCACGKRAEGM